MLLCYFWACKIWQSLLWFCIVCTLSNNQIMMVFMIWSLCDAISIWKKWWNKSKSNSIYSSFYHWIFIFDWLGWLTWQDWRILFHKQHEAPTSNLEVRHSLNHVCCLWFLMKAFYLLFFLITKTLYSETTSSVCNHL